MAKKRTKTNCAKLACQVMQQHARLSETDNNGYGYCVSCGTMVHYSECDGGHFQPKGRTYNAACIDPRNIHIQCKSCNGFSAGNPAGYSDYMVRQYGIEILDELFTLSKQLGDKNRFLEAIEEYREKNRKLAQQKTFELKLY